MITRVLAILLAITALTTTGCAVVAVGAVVGGVAYASGDLEANLDSSIPRTINAVNDAFDKMNFHKTGQKRIPAAGSRPEVRRLFATDPQGQSVKITVEPATPFTTHISVRVGGGTGKKEAAQQILNSIKRHL